MDRTCNAKKRTYFEQGVMLPFRFSFYWPSCNNMYIRDRIEGGQWGFGHLRIGIFEKLVTLEISKNSLYKAIFSTFWTFYV